MLAQEACPDCGHKNFFLNREKGEAICRNCSCVVEDSIVDLGRDSVAFDEDTLESNTRTGAPFDPRIANNLSTTIGSQDDIRKLSGKSKAMVSRLRKKHSWANTSFEHSLNHAMDHLRMLSGKLDLPRAVEKEAAMIYRRAAEKGLTLKRSKEDIMVGAVFVACKLHSIPRSMKEIAREGKADLKILGKTYKLLLRELDIRIMPTSPHDCISKFANQLKLSPKTQTASVKMVEKMQKQGLLSGLSPLSIAASALYISCITEKERRTQKEVASATGITEATLRARCRRIAKQLHLKYKIR